MKKLFLLMAMICIGTAMAIPVRSLVGVKSIVSSESPELPYDAEVEYIHIQSGACIDTEMPVCSAFGIQFTFRINRLVGYCDTYFCAVQSDGNGFRLRRKETSTDLLEYYWLPCGVKINVLIDEKCIAEANSPSHRQYLYYNGENVGYMTSINYKMTAFPLTFGRLKNSSGFFCL